MRALTAFWLKQLRLLVACVALSVAVQPGVTSVAPAPSAQTVLVERRTPAPAGAPAGAAVSRRAGFVSSDGKHILARESASPRSATPALVTQVPRGDRRRLYLEHDSWLC